MVYTQANGTIAAGGTPQRLNAARVAATWVLVQATQGNSGDIYVGGVNPASKQTSLVNATGKVGVRLTAGSTFLFPVVATTTPYDLHEMWVDGTTNDTFSVTWLVK